MYPTEELCAAQISTTVEETGVWDLIPQVDGVGALELVLSDSYSHLSSLLLKKKKTVRTSHKKVFRMNTNACRDETLDHQPNEREHHNTLTPSLHLVPFCELCTTKKLFTHSLNEHDT